ncbi:TetR/AcrR family transcriptional regulator [Streptodolium elevatio]|uniref:Helix-turn-helix domain-containing protein n=1 Tax=Streptodolium elevatio TaxID=3157996 RepID=A0ABV3DUC4_9ACTN
MPASTHPSSESKGRSPSLDMRARQKIYTRQRLIAAASNLFETKGYEATTVDDIVAEAGAARATFYLHFTGKPDIVGALADRIWADTEAKFAVWDVHAVLDGGPLDARAFRDARHPDSCVAQHS